MSTLGTLNDETCTLSTILSSNCSISDNQLRGYDYELLGGVDSKFECPICLLYMRDPVQTKCGHRFCRSCISRWILNQETEYLCPYCSVPISGENTFADTSTRREILACIAKCPYSSEGCKVTLAISDMEKHVETAHPQPYPIWQGPGSYGAPLACDQGMDCIVRKVGCSAAYPPEQLQKHLEMEPNAHYHLQLCTGVYSKRHKRHVSRPNGDFSPSNTNNSFSRQSSRESDKWLLADDFDVDDYNFRRQRSWDSVRFARRFNAIEHGAGCSYTAEHFDPVKKYPSRHSSGKEAHQSKQSLVGDSNSSVTENDNYLKDVMERLVKLEQLSQEKDIKIAHLESQLGSAVGYCSKVANMIKDLHTRYSNGILVWKLTDLEGRCKDLRRNTSKHCTSPAFYTHQFGYKMSLRFNLTTATSSVSANGDVPLESDESTLVSLYIHFMQGEFDCANEWPFKGEITIMIVHPQDPEKVISETIRSKGEAAAFKKPTLPRSLKGIGYPDMCSLHKLFSEGFVQNDTLILKVLAKAG